MRTSAPPSIVFQSYSGGLLLAILELYHHSYEPESGFRDILQRAPGWIVCPNAEMIMMIITCVCLAFLHADDTAMILTLVTTNLWTRFKDSLHHKSIPKFVMWTWAECKSLPLTTSNSPIALCDGQPFSIVSYFTWLLPFHITFLVATHDDLSLNLQSSVYPVIYINSVIEYWITGYYLQHIRPQGAQRLLFIQGGVLACANTHVAGGHEYQTLSIGMLTTVWY